MKTLLLLSIVCLAAGCARMTQTLSSSTVTTNGVVEAKTTKVTAWAVWDAKNTIDKLRVSNGKTHSIGLSDQEQVSHSTNVAATLDALTRLLISVK